jgi:daunorubicin resistance ABC transporter membrane protein
MLRLWRERSRWFGVILQPLIFWLIIGSGMANSFKAPTSMGMDYLQYTYPGIMVMIILFTSIFATIGVIEDRSSGFLQGVLVAPGSRASLVIGMVAGVTTLALIQSLLFALLSPWTGYDYGGISWGLLVAAVILTNVGLTALGFAMAWILDSVQAYHAVMSVLLLPLWILSGAMFPPQGNWVDWVMTVNPMTYAVSLVRHALDSEIAQNIGPSAGLSILVLAGFACVTVIFAVWTTRRSAS